ncbi:shikimate kinase [Pseudomarimonas salicorniae]|uniref:Shikimate kinase n=1 Tax=Pseudomarimonas salicorniae TaxID=2933270 RepID=A0ABT0GKE7_9GAMM|nr:shikimate kinase [Lysobacter sp. CAU 1642]MCK7595013.1 shikimate kinase [Lysobacter sp. CAU 1642]
MNPASNLILVGPMGAGKSSIGKRLARRFGLAFVDVDEAIEAQTGARIPVIFELEGEAGFRRRESELLAELCAGRDQLIATGGGAVLSEANRSLLSRSGFVVWLRTGVERQLDRLAQDRCRPLLQVPDRERRLRAMAAERDPLYRAVCDLAFDSDQRRVSVAAERLAGLLAGHWQRDAHAA